ncbi:Translation initiation factor IF-2, partial [Phytophthora megakarya]
MLRLLRPSTAVLRAGASQLLLPNGARSLRTARGGARRHKDHMARIAKVEAVAQDRERARLEQSQRVLEARSQPPVIPAFIRVRDLAKALRQPLDKVLKRTVTKANRRFQLKSKNHPPAEFRSVKHIVLPFRVAQEVAETFDIQVAYDDVEPELSDASADYEEEFVGVRQPVIAVMGHVDHGKTTLMDTLRKQMKAGLKQIAPYEKHGITQKINVCEATLTSDVKATFLDTPGHFHFFRMRSSAAQVADAVLLIVAADEGVLLQTEESIGAIEEAGLPAIICINKVDLLGEDGDKQVENIVDELRSFVALQDSPVLMISGKTGAGLDDLRHTVWELVSTLADDNKLDALIGSKPHAEGLVLESVALKGRGTVLRVLIKNGELVTKQHFVAGMIHGVVRSMRDAEGHDVKRAPPGSVVDITYSNKSKNVDAPNEHGFFVRPEARAKQVIEQRELALEFNDCLLPDEGGAHAGTDAEYTSVSDEGFKSNVPDALEINDE